VTRSNRHLRVAEPGETRAPDAKPRLRGPELDRALAHALERLAAGTPIGNGDGLVPPSLRDFLR
jgi:hypothetical protein